VTLTTLAILEQLRQACLLRDEKEISRHADFLRGDCSAPRVSALLDVLKKRQYAWAEEIARSIISQAKEPSVPEWVQVLWSWADVNDIPSNKIPRNYQALTTLTELDLSGCMSIGHLPPEISFLTNVYRIDLTFCLNLVKIDDAIGSMAALEWLSFESCDLLTSLPETLSNLHNLRVLTFKNCSVLEVMPDIFERMYKLEKLDLDQCKNIKYLPESMGNLRRLLYLRLRDCSALLSLPVSIGNLSELKVLDLEGCTALECIPQGVGSLTKLTEIDVSGVDDPRNIPAEIAEIRGLNVLRLRASEALPQWVSLMTSLTELDLTGSIKLQNLSEQVTQLVKLKTLKLNNCKSLETLPERMSNLVTLDTSGCDSLLSLPVLPSLETLIFSNKSKVDFTPAFIEELKKLSTLVLSLSDNCSSSLLPRLSAFPALTSLILTETWGMKTRVTALPIDFSSLRRLAHLRFEGLRELEFLDESLLSCASLRSIKVSGSPKIKALPAGLMGRSGLTVTVTN